MMHTHRDWNFCVCPCILFDRNAIYFHRITRIHLRAIFRKIYTPFPYVHRYYCTVSVLLYIVHMIWYMCYAKYLNAVIALQCMRVVSENTFLPKKSHSFVLILTYFRSSLLLFLSHKASLSDAFVVFLVHMQNQRRIVIEIKWKLCVEISPQFILVTATDKWRRLWWYLIT